MEQIVEIKTVLRAQNLKALANSLEALMAYNGDLVDTKLRLHPRLEVLIGRIWVETQPHPTFGRTKNVETFLVISQDTSGCGHLYQNIYLLIEDRHSQNVYQRSDTIRVGTNFRGDRCNSASSTTPRMKWLES